MDIVVLVGGYSNERNVSFSSGAMVANALRENGHNVAIVDVFMGVEGTTTLPQLFADEIPESWYMKASTPVVLNDVCRDDDSNSLIGPNVLDICSKVDVVFLALHGGYGEDGRIQACLDCLGIKYTGADYLSSGIAMNKDITKVIASKYGINTPKWDVIYLDSKDIIDITVTNTEAYPVVVKVPNSGSSVGVYIVNSNSELKSTLCENFGRKLVIEQYIKGREIQMAFLGESALPSIEIIPVSEYYTYNNKYKKGGAIEQSPADIEPQLESKMADMLMGVVKCIGISDYSRADFIIDDNNEIWFIEINTLPGMTATSLLPQEATAAGFGFNKLCDMMVDMAVQKKVGLEKERESILK